MRTSWLLSLFALVLSLLVGGCTIVRVTGAQPVTTVHFGVLALAPAIPGGMVAVETTGFGLVPGVNGATLGFASSHMVFMDDASHCSLVIFETGNDPQSRAFWTKVLADAQQLCNKGENDDGVEEQ